MILLLAAITLVIGLATWIGTRDPQARAERHVAPAKIAADATDPPSASAVKLETPSSSLDLPIEAESRESALPLSTSIPDAAHSAACIVHGRVVDERDRPLAGVAVRLQATSRWSEAVEAPPLPSSPSVRGFETRTSVDGSFRFDVHPPSIQTTFVTIEPDLFHDWAQLTFSTTRGRSSQPLAAGEHDLGLIRLVSTGSIRGRVVDASGRSVRGARVSVGDERSSTFAMKAESGVDGTYTIGHVRGDSARVHVRCDGFLSQTGEPVDVRGDAFTDDVDFVLEAAPTLQGIVVDEMGVPVAEVNLEVRPSSSGEGTRVKSAFDGSFTAYLPQSEAYSIEASHPGFDPYPDHKFLSTHAPGTRDIRVEMRRATTWALRVVDEEAGSPVELFSVVVRLDTSAHSREQVFVSDVPDRMQAHPDGRVDVAWRPGTDTLVIAAPDYARKVVDLHPTEIRDELIVVKLKRGATIEGRVMRDGAPASGAEVSLEPGQLGPDAGAFDGTRRQRDFWIDSSRIQRANADADGRFRFEGLLRGSYRIVAREEKGGIHETEPLDLSTRERKDVGDLELASTATIVGSVLIPPGRSAADLTIHLNQWDSGPRETTDERGTFRFTGLASGEHRLMMKPVSGAIVDPPPLDVTVRESQEVRVVYDVSDRGPGAVALTILFASRPVANREVSLVVPGEPERNARLGRTDAHGRVAGWTRAGVEASVEVMTDSWSQIRHPTQRIRVELDQRVEATVDFAIGELVLLLPASFELPLHGRAIVVLTPDSERNGRSLALALDLERNSATGADAFVDRAARSLHFTTVLDGSYDVQLLVSTDPEFNTSMVDLASRAALIHPDVPGRWFASAVVTTGKRTEVELR